VAIIDIIVDIIDIAGTNHEISTHTEAHIKHPNGGRDIINNK